MKKRKWLYLLPIVACAAVFFGYRILEQRRADTAAPEIRISEEVLQVSVQDPRTALLQGVTASDDNDGDVTASLIVESVQLTDDDGTVRVVYAAFDRAGNVAKASREVRYTDYQSPRFSLSVPLVFSQSSIPDVLSVIRAEDTLDGDISHRIRATSLDDSLITATGVHDVEFRVTNSLGQTVKLVFPVEVYTTGTYNATLALTDNLIYLDAGSSFDAQRYLKSFTWESQTTGLRPVLPEGFTVDTTGTVDTSTPGVYSVAYRVTYTKVSETDPRQNRSYTGYTRLIVVVEG